MHTFWMSLLFIMLSSCAHQKSVSLRSDKLVEVNIIYKGEKRRVKASKKLNFKTSELSKTFPGYREGDNFSLEVIKDDHYSQIVHFSASLKDNNIIDISLNQKEDPFDAQIMDNVIQELFEVQRLLKYKKSRDAIVRLNKLELEYPKLSIVYELRASAFYFLGDYKKAYHDFKMAWKYNSANSEAKRMIKFMETKIASVGK